MASPLLPSAKTCTHDLSGRPTASAKGPLSRPPGRPLSDRLGVLERLHHVNPDMRILAVSRRPATHDLEAMPAIKPDVALCHLGGLERQSLQSVRPRDFLDAHQQEAPEAAALACRIDPQPVDVDAAVAPLGDRKSTRLNSSHVAISYAVFCLKKKK